MNTVSRLGLAVLPVLFASALQAGVMIDPGTTGSPANNPLATVSVGLGTTDFLFTKSIENATGFSWSFDASSSPDILFNITTWLTSYDVEIPGTGTGFVGSVGGGISVAGFLPPLPSVTDFHLSLTTNDSFVGTVDFTFAVIGTVGDPVNNGTVPEPASLAIFGALGMAGFAARRKRKQNA